MHPSEDLEPFPLPAEAEPQLVVTDASGPLLISRDSLYLRTPDPVPPKPVPHLYTEEQSRASRSFRRILQVIVRELAATGPLGRRALMCEIQERCTRDIAAMDEAARRSDGRDWNQNLGFIQHETELGGSL